MIYKFRKIETKSIVSKFKIIQFVKKKQKKNHSSGIRGSHANVNTQNFSN